LSKVQLHIVGRVQGVCYRQSAQQIAKSLKLFGWVRNLPDGSVQAYAEGAPVNIEAFLDWCKQGPPRAKVDSVKVTWLPGEDSAREESIPPLFEIIG
jgi:acylphosphatase